MTPAEALEELRRGKLVCRKTDSTTWFQLFQHDLVYWLEPATFCAAGIIAIFKEDQFVRAFTRDKEKFVIKNDSV